MTSAIFAIGHIGVLLAATWSCTTTTFWEEEHERSKGEIVEIAEIADSPPGVDVRGADSDDGGDRRGGCACAGRAGGSSATPRASNRVHHASDASAASADRGARLCAFRTSALLSVSRL